MQVRPLITSHASLHVTLQVARSTVSPCPLGVSLPLAYPGCMDEPDDSVQQTPQGQTIPVPARGDVLRDLRRVAKAPERPSDTDA